MKPPELQGAGGTGVAPRAARPVLFWARPVLMHPGGHVWDERLVLMRRGRDTTASSIRGARPVFLRTPTGRLPH
eukprot:1720838-Pyramimonas_sp.AAC.1